MSYRMPDVFPAWAGMNLDLTGYVLAENVFPAWAGMNLAENVRYIKDLCIPRMGGDEPQGQ